MSVDPAEITGLVLAGGRGSRMGNVDKGLQKLRGYPMVAHVLARLAPQVGPILINANQNQPIYAALGYKVIHDSLEGFAGPLAGLQAGLSHCETPYLLSVPCDSPFLPTDLAARLALGLEGEYADIAVALAEGRAQPVFSLMRRTVAESLAGFLDSGGRKIDLWTATLRCASVSFEDENAAFRNINTLEDLAQNDKPDA